MFKLVVGVNDLETWCKNNGDWGQQLISEWVGKDENNNPISMQDVSRGMLMKVHWVCKDGHKWIASVRNRTKGSSCPECMRLTGRIKLGVNDLATWCAANKERGDTLISEWRGVDEDGQQIAMSDVTKGTSKRVLWCCKHGHEWYASVSNRTNTKRNTGCPVCAVSKMGNNDLKTWCENNGDYGAQLMTEWQGLSESGEAVEMHAVAAGSNKRVLWHCNAGHTWAVAVNTRTISHTSCPICANRSAKLIVGENDLETWCSANPVRGAQLVSEWVGRDELNVAVDMKSVTRASNRKVYWTCNLGHTWLAKINNRTSVGTDCPECMKLKKEYGVFQSDKLSVSDTLESWCKNHGERGERLISEWVGEDVDGNPIEMSDVEHKSTLSVKWRCSVCSNIWATRIINRVKEGSNCHVCVNKAAGTLAAKSRLERIGNDLYTWCMNSSTLGALLLSEWTGRDSLGNSVDMKSISVGSNREVFWRCENGHEWVASVLRRTQGHNYCPQCKSLEYWCETHGAYGDYLRSQFREAISDTSLTLKDISRAAGIPVLWRCEHGHEWKAPPSSRTSTINICPKCRHAQVSVPELWLYSALSQIFTDVRHKNRFFNDIKVANRYGVEIDIAVMQPKLFIEYSSVYWHEGREHMDVLKRNLCIENDIPFLRIYEYSIGDKDFKPLWTDDCVNYQYQSIDDLYKVLEHILSILGKGISCVDLDKVFKDMLAYIDELRKIKLERSLGLHSD